MPNAQVVSICAALLLASGILISGQVVGLHVGADPARSAETPWRVVTR